MTKFKLEQKSKCLAAYANCTKSFSTCPLLNHIIKNSYLHKIKSNKHDNIVFAGDI